MWLSKVVNTFHFRCATLTAFGFWFKWPGFEDREYEGISDLEQL